MWHCYNEPLVIECANRNGIRQAWKHIHQSSFLFKLTNVVNPAIHSGSPPSRKSISLSQSAHRLQLLEYRNWSICCIAFTCLTIFIVWSAKVYQKIMACSVTYKIQPNKYWNILCHCCVVWLNIRTNIGTSNKETPRSTIQSYQNDPEIRWLLELLTMFVGILLLSLLYTIMISI